MRSELDKNQNLLEQQFSFFAFIAMKKAFSLVKNAFVERKSLRSVSLWVQGTLVLP